MTEEDYTINNQIISQREVLREEQLVEIALKSNLLCN